MGNWDFSIIRLNMHVALHAAQEGGVMIVDATRNAHKGGFPVSEDISACTCNMWTDMAAARPRVSYRRGLFCTFTNSTIVHMQVLQRNVV